MDKAKHIIFFFIPFLVLNCANTQKEAQSTNKTVEDTMSTGSSGKFTLTSPAFKEGDAIPLKYTADGQNISPPLKWSPVPTQTKSLALIVDDPDAPAGIWVHWVIFNIPANVNELPENIPTASSLSNGALQGKNDSRDLGYEGPSPPGGTHRYFFKLYALDAMLNLSAGSTKADLLKAMEGHVIGETVLMGRYSR